MTTCGNCARERRRQLLTELLAEFTGAGEDFDQDYAGILITIGQGMFWTKELDMAARALAVEVDKGLAPYRTTPE